MIKLLFILCIFLYSSLYSESITFLTHSTANKVYLNENGNMRGIKHAGRRSFYIELIREMMNIVGYQPKSIHEVTYKRGLSEVQNKDNFAFFNATRIKDRETTVKWIGPIQTSKVFIYSAVNFPKTIKSLTEAKKLNTICILNGTSHEVFLVKNKFKNIIRNNSYESCFKMLIKGRVDATVLSDISLTETLKAAQISSSQIKRNLFLFKTEGYLTMSNNISDNTITIWQNALEFLKVKGTYGLLMSQYFEK